jgi:cytoskeletal protein CcmA (bactofilin family)
LWNRSGKSPVKAKGVTAFIDESSEIEGKYTFSGVVLLNGRFKGEIISSDTLIIGEKGVINATIRAGAVVINGEVVGAVVANERVEMKQSARVFGDVEAPVVVIEEGVLFDGHCRITKGLQAKTATIPEAEDDAPAPVLLLKR